jgi:hypothetical protein
MGSIYKMMHSVEKAAMPPKVGRRKLYDELLLIRLPKGTLARINAVVPPRPNGKAGDRSAVIREAIEREVERRKRPTKRRKRGD